LQDILAGTQPELERIALGHRLLIDVPADLPRIKADQERVAQVMINLVSNAAKYSPVDTTIHISAQQAADYLRVDVKDEGLGIPREERVHIFEAFRRGESVRRIKGSGLGLAICRGVVEAHGGHIWIADHDGPGAMISFTVPVAS
jgi:two-component system sensor histidine kinase KdpD